MTERESRVTADEAAVLLQIPANTIRQWRRRGRVVPVGYVRGRGKPAPLYALDELRPLAEAWRDRIETRRKEHDS